MNRCLNCEKEVINKYCGVTCQNEFRGKNSILDYNNNPKECFNCESPLEYNKRNYKFCSSSCSATSNNQLRGRKRNINQGIKFLMENNIDFVIKKSGNLMEFYKNIGYKSRPSTESRVKIKLYLAKRGYDIDDLKNKSNISEVTKGELFEKRKNWQSARSSIAEHARRTFFGSEKNKKCFVCGYNSHIDVAHIKSVSEFDDDKLISHINDITNLVGLCPNHHWEFDNGLLKI